MAREPKGSCEVCQVPLMWAKSKLCRTHWMERHMAKDSRPKCLTCGKDISWNQATKYCWEHFAEQKAQAKLPPKTCERCGEPVSTRKTRLCMTCIREEAVARKTAHTCNRCKTPLTKPTATHCTSCYRDIEKELAAERVCSRDGCDKHVKGQGLCGNHYRAMVRKDVRRRKWGPREQIKAMPCAICGYNRLKSEPHRIVPGTQGGLYVIGNMVPLCSRCHDEVEAGLATCPPAPIFGSVDACDLLETLAATGQFDEVDHCAMVESMNT